MNRKYIRSVIVILSSALILGLMSFSPKSYSQTETEGIVACYGKKVKEGKFGAVLANKSVINELDKHPKFKSLTYFSRTKIPAVQDLILIMEVYPEVYTYIRFDRDLKERNGVIMGITAEKMGLSAKSTRGCEVIIPMKICPVEKNPSFSIMC